MKIQFNNNLEALYAVDYCINRGQNIIRQDENPANQSYFDELYRIYLEKISDKARSDAVAIGDYHRKAEFALNPQNTLPELSAFQTFFTQHKILQNTIVADIENSEAITQLHLEGLRGFFGIPNINDINIILSMFINGGFGIFNGESNIVLGVKFDSATNHYKIANYDINNVYHDFAAPYVHMYLYEEGINVDGDVEQLSEVITRVLAIIFTSRLYGDQYIDSALQAQDKMHLSQIRIFLSIYLEHKANIYTLKDYINLILENNLATKA
jgi:hypothetical protein